MPAFAAPLLGVAIALVLGASSRSGDLRREDAAAAAVARFGWLALLPAVACSAVLDPGWSTGHLVASVDRAWIVALVAGALVAATTGPLAQAACGSTRSSTALFAASVCAVALALAGVVALDPPSAPLAQLGIGALAVAGFGLTLRAVRGLAGSDAE